VASAAAAVAAASVVVGGRALGAWQARGAMLVQVGAAQGVWPVEVDGLPGCFGSIGGQSVGQQEQAAHRCRCWHRPRKRSAASCFDLGAVGCAPAAPAGPQVPAAAAAAAAVGAEACACA